MDANTGRGGTPWPEPDPEPPSRSSIRAEAEDVGADAAEVAAGLEAAGGRIVDHLDDLDDRVAEWDRRTDAAAGSKGVALVVAGLNVGLLLLVPALLVVLVYTFVTVYAIVKAIASGPDTASPEVVLLGVVGIVTVLALLLGVGTWVVGRGAEPKKRAR